MSIDTHHLFVKTLAIILKFFGKTRALPQPFLACQRIEGRRKCCWTSSNWRVGTRCVERPRGICGGGRQRCGVCGEDLGIEYLARDPDLDELYVLRSGKLCGLPICVEPSICVAKSSARRLCSCEKDDLRSSRHARAGHGIAAWLMSRFVDTLNLLQEL